MVNSNRSFSLGNPDDPRECSLHSRFFMGDSNGQIRLWQNMNGFSFDPEMDLIGLQDSQYIGKV